MPQISGGVTLVEAAQALVVLATFVIGLFNARKISRVRSHQKHENGEAHGNGNAHSLQEPPAEGGEK